jgi:hypothetical protein
MRSNVCRTLFLSMLTVGCAPGDQEAIRACESAADRYLEECGSADAQGGEARACGVRLFRGYCGHERSDRIAGVYDCFSERTTGSCPSFFDLATSEIRACVWSVVEPDPSAARAPGVARYCALCPGECTRDANPPPLFYLGDDSQDAILERCLAGAATCDAASECVLTAPELDFASCET